MEQPGSDTIVTVGGEFPCREAVYKGIVHVPIYDAMDGIKEWYEPYKSHAAAPVAAYADDRGNVKALRHSGLRQYHSRERCH